MDGPHQIRIVFEEKGDQSFAITSLFYVIGSDENDSSFSGTNKNNSQNHGLIIGIVVACVAVIVIVVCIVIFAIGKKKAELNTTDQNPNQTEFNVETVNYYDEDVTIQTSTDSGNMKIFDDNSDRDSIHFFSAIGFEEN